jgi:glycerol-3-phosphate cytidylyltransferase
MQKPTNILPNAPNLIRSGYAELVDLRNDYNLAPCTLTYGTFDVFHYGHLELLINASSLGLPLRIGLSTDEFNIQKNKHAKLTYSQREKLLLNIKNVEMIFPENNWEQKKTDIVKYNAKFLVMGSDWTNKFDSLSHMIEVRYFTRTVEISSHEIRNITS